MTKPYREVLKAIHKVRKFVIRGGCEALHNEDVFMRMLEELQEYLETVYK